MRRRSVVRTAARGTRRRHPGGRRSSARFAIMARGMRLDDAHPRAEPADAAPAAPSPPPRAALLAVAALALVSGAIAGAGGERRRRRRRPRGRRRRSAGTATCACSPAREPRRSTSSSGRRRTRRSTVRSRERRSCAWPATQTGDRADVRRRAGPVHRAPARRRCSGCACRRRSSSSARSAGVRYADVAARRSTRACRSGTTRGPPEPRAALRGATSARRSSSGARDRRATARRSRASSARPTAPTTRRRSSCSAERGADGAVVGRQRGLHAAGRRRDRARTSSPRPPGAIVLMHDGGGDRAETSPRSRGSSAAARAGLPFVTVPRACSSTTRRPP